jgi:hypothetical protein
MSEPRRNRIGTWALLLSASGLISLFVFSAPSLMWLLPTASLICPVGLALGLLGLRQQPRLTAAWAVGLGIWGSLYVPTIWLSFFRAA